MKVAEQEAIKGYCVFKEVADEMALNVSSLFNTDWGISLTGYATPVKESDQKIFAHFSFTYKNEIIFFKKNWSSIVKQKLQPSSYGIYSRML
ncbi:CinA family protein [Chryseobacterium sp. TY4]